MTKVVSSSYEKSGGIAEQSINLLRTVLFLNGQNKEISNYNKGMENSESQIQKYGFFAGFAFGATYLSVFSSYALGAWYGGKLVQEENGDYDGARVISCFLSIIMSGGNLSGLSPILKSFSEAKNALGRVIPLLERKPPINIEDETGIKIESFHGKIEFKNVDFNYPARKEVEVFKKLNVVLQEKKKTALVGESGCGKTTITYLIERFYDVDQGNILIDDKDVKSYNLKSLRRNIGYVGQEPTLFATSIYENIKFAKENATEEEIHDAAKRANAYQFIMSLDKKFDTYVGTSGVQLSGYNLNNN